MTARQCSQCEAPLPKGVPGEAIRCAYCGAEHEPEPAKRAADLLEQLGAAKRAGKRERSFFPIILVIGGLAVLAAIAVGAVLATRANDPGAEAVQAAAASAPTPAPAPPVERKLPVSEMSRVALDQPQEIDAPLSAAQLSRFDALASLEWATRIARAWSTDAEIWDITVRGLRADGTADLTSRDDFSVEYQFKSAARRGAAIQLGAVSEKGVPSDLLITIGGGRVRARSFAPTARYLAEVATRPAMRPSCPLAKVVAAALRAGVAAAPFWDAETSFTDELGWNWSFENGEHRVAAADCASADGALR